MSEYDINITPYDNVISAISEMDSIKNNYILIGKLHRKLQIGLALLSDDEFDMINATNSGKFTNINKKQKQFILDNSNLPNDYIQKYSGNYFYPIKLPPSPIDSISPLSISMSPSPPPLPPI
jgi:hypothetical protein